MFLTIVTYTLYKPDEGTFNYQNCLENNEKKNKLTCVIRVSQYYIDEMIPSFTNLQNILKLFSMI